MFKATKNSFEFLFKETRGKIFYFLIIVIFLSGVYEWSSFINGGNFYTGGYLDWKNNQDHYSLAKQFSEKMVLPYKFSIEGREEWHHTSNYLGDPETILAPHILLLKILDVPTFFHVNVIFLYVLGFIGCLLLAQKFKLSLFSFYILFLLYNFNGHLSSHLMVGHESFLGYFFFPLFLFFTFKLLDESFFLKDAFLLGIVLSLCLLQGAFHQFIWCMFFLFCFVFVGKKYLKPIIVSAAISVLIASVKILPVLFSLLGIDAAGKTFGFIGGYPNVGVFFESLIRSHTQSYKPEFYNGLSWWEFDIYIGVLGLLFIGVFGIFYSYKHKSISNRIFIPIIFLSAFSFGSFYKIIYNSGIPLLQSERVTSRFFIIPLVALIVISTKNFQKWISSKNLKNLKWGFLSLFLLLLMKSDLFKHRKLWNFSNNWPESKGVKFDYISDLQILNTGISASYKLSVQVGFFISLIVFIFVVSSLFFKKTRSINLLK